MNRRGYHRLPLLSVMLLMAGCAPQGLSFLAPGGPAAQSELSHFVTITLGALVAILPVFIIVPVLLWRYRLRGGRGRYAPRWSESRVLELVMWGIPFVIVGFLGYQLTRNAFDLDPYRPINPSVAPLRVQAVALNWKWLFILPDQGIATVDHLTVPVGVPVEFVLTSDSVMQSFMVSALAGQIYAMPGMETRQFLRADVEGDYVGRNTQYNGPEFAGQNFVLHAVTPAGFNAWVTEVRAGGGRLDHGRYAILAAPSTGDTAADALNRPLPLSFGAVDPGLYGSILRRYMAPGGVPAVEQPGAPGYTGATTARDHQERVPTP